MTGGLPSSRFLVALLSQPAGAQNLKPGGGQAPAYQNKVGLLDDEEYGLDMSELGTVSFPDFTKK